MINTSYEELSTETSEAQIHFDKSDRTYQLGEEITGKILLEVSKDTPCHKIWIEYGWHTHGKGDVADGGRTIITLYENIDLKGREPMALPFRFTAPNGPVSYHGFFINVDWYISVHMILPNRADIHDGQDFLLLGSGTAREINLGNRTLKKDELPIHTHSTVISKVARTKIESRYQPEEPIPTKYLGKLIGIPLLIAVFFLSLAIFSHYKMPGLAVILTMFVYAIFFISYQKIINGIARLRIKIIKLQVEPRIVYVGQQINCQLEFQNRGAKNPKYMLAMLSAEERIELGAGTQRTMFKQVSYRDTVSRRVYGNHNPLKPINLQCSLPITQEAPVTFMAGGNSIRWKFDIYVVFNEWLAWKTSIPLTVLPG
jgi:hypothetical protein